MITEDMQNMTNGLLFNALPVPCSQQVYKILVFPLVFSRFFAPQGGPRWHRFSIDFLIDFGSVLGSILELLGGVLGRLRASCGRLGGVLGNFVGVGGAMLS